MKSGFTLIEILVVITILGLLATFIGPKILSRPDEARVSKCVNDITAIESALKLYKLDTGVFPTTEQGLKALITLPDTDPIPRGWKAGGYLDTSSTPKDPWNRDYIYRSPTDVDGRDYEIISLGSDGKDGGESFNADVKSYELR